MKSESMKSYTGPETSPGDTERLRALDQKAGQVAEQMEAADLENLSGERIAKLIDANLVICGTLLLLAGAVSLHQVWDTLPAFDSSHVGEVISALGRGNFFGPTLSGLAAFLTASGLRRGRGAE